MYAYSELGDLGARHQRPPAIPTLQKRIASLQERITKLQARLATETNATKKLHIQAQLDEWNKRLIDLQLQLAQLQAGVPPVTGTTGGTTSTTTSTTQTVVTGTTPSADVTQLIPASGSIPLASSLPASGSIPLASSLPALFSNPWLIGGALILLLMMPGKSHASS